MKRKDGKKAKRTAVTIFAICMLAALISGCGGGGGGKLPYVPQSMARECANGPTGRRALSQTAPVDSVQCVQIHEHGQQLPILKDSTLTVQGGATKALDAVIYDYSCADITSGFAGSFFSWSLSNPSLGSIGNASHTVSFNSNVVSADATGTITISLYTYDAQNNYTLIKQDVIAVKVLAPTTPNPPTGLTATAGNGQVGLSWTAPTTNTNSTPITDLAGYNVYYGTVSGGPYSLANTSLITGTSYTVTGLTNGTPYYFVATAVDNESSPNTSAHSTEATATPAATINNPPTASAAASPTSGTAPLAVNFTGGCTDSDGSCISYSWNFGDGSPTSSTQNPAHTYSSAGTYTATLTVTDDDGATDTDTVSITVSAGGALTVTATTNSTEAALNINTGIAAMTLTCTVGGGSPTSLEGRCYASDSWQTIPSGNSMTCSYASPGRYTPGCRVNGATTDDADAPIYIGYSGPRVAAGTSHTCFLNGSGAVKCMGNGIDGQLGDGNSADSATPVQVQGLTGGAFDVSAGEDHSCAIVSDGNVMCWGKNDRGQLGDGTNNNSATPVHVSNLSGAVAIKSSYYFTCALVKDTDMPNSGYVKCWGENSDGQLGNGTGVDSNVPVAVTPGALPVVDIALGGNHACRRNSDNSACCWGNNSHYQLGDGTTTTRLSPVPVASGASFLTYIGAGMFFTCGGSTSGNFAKCWGYDSNGQLGGGGAIPGSDMSSPTTVSLASSVADISGGETHTCAALANGDAYCWGSNWAAQLGNNSQVDSSSPVQVSGLTGVKQISGGGYHTCAATASAIYCWGLNDMGECGDGTTTTYKLTPVAVIYP